MNVSVSRQLPIHAPSVYGQFKFDTVKSLSRARNWDASKRRMAKKCHIENSYRRDELNVYIL